jgi:hypothetical protein
MHIALIDGALVGRDLSRRIPSQGADRRDKILPDAKHYFVDSVYEIGRYCVPDLNHTSIARTDNWKSCCLTLLAR